MPLTASGKIDRKALPQYMGLINSGVEYVAPKNEIEKELVKIWQQILHREQIGIKDNFFVLGGHSLKATKLAITDIAKTFNVEVPLREVFKLQTIKGWRNI